MTKVTVDADAAAGLAAIPYLAPLSARERAGLASRCLVKNVAKGKVIFAEGEPATGLWVVLAGRVRLVRISPRGREQALHVESAGATLAEAPIFDGGGYVATALAETEARLLFVPRPALLDLCRRRPDVALGVIGVLARRVRAFAAVIENLALRNVTARLARLLLTEVRGDGNVVDLSGTREEIALRLGTARELVSRSLSELRAAGIVVVRGRRVWLTDERRLATIAELA
jgi:CRP/FNR family transcriptional regulator, dissimilatory nitrate respiration regulator